MRIKLPENTWTPINTDPDKYLMQNISNTNVYIIVSDTQPGDGISYDFEVPYLDGIGSNCVSGLLWGKPKGQIEIQVGLIEG